MEKYMLITFIISFLVTAVSGYFLIPFLRRLKMGQTERVEGVESHLKKAGTPTMGGIMFIAGILAASATCVWKYKEIAPVLFLVLAFAAIGFVDDYLKVVKRDSDGLLPKQKLFLQFLVTLIFYLILRLMKISLVLRIPFSGKMVDIGFFAIPLLFFAVLGTVNAVNLTDGIDGLASSVTIIVAVFFTYAASKLGSGIAPITVAVIGGLSAFLLYNSYPAKVFMGDTGSLALGGFVAGAAYVLQMPLFIIIIGLIYLVEILSVMIQVTYFKATHGKRIFKMSPIHHHFELSGWSETQIVTRFSIATMILMWIAIIAM